MEAATEQTESRPHATTAPDASLDSIRHRAYEIYIARGAADGHALDDWLEAERLLAGPRSPTEGHGPTLLG
jgi:hypothetical protein